MAEPRFDRRTGTGYISGNQEESLGFKLPFPKTQPPSERIFFAAVAIFQESE
jgi:hypothetical protein